MANVKHNVLSDDRNHQTDNPLKDNLVYEVTFTDGTTEEISANTIAECMVFELDA